MTTIPASRSLDSLSPQMRPLIDKVLARLMERGVYVVVVQTLRTMAEQQANIAAGTSKVTLSKHLPRKLRGFNEQTRGGEDDPSVETCDAIDLAPIATFAIDAGETLAWNPTLTPARQAAWQAIRDEGERVGLRSGARWKDPYDPGHLEYVWPGERHPDMPEPRPAATSTGSAAVGTTGAKTL